MYFGLARRNPSYVTEHWRNLASTKRSMEIYRRQNGNGVCAYCRSDKQIEIHHIEPVSVNPTLADSWANMIPLCKKCHLAVGHAGNYKTSYVQNVRALCHVAQIVKTEAHDEDEKPAPVFDPATHAMLPA